MSFFFFFLFFSLTTPVANGDVRLAMGDQNEVWKGDLEVYLDGQWGLVCSAGFNNGSADAACREIGRTQHRRWSTLKEMK